MNRLRRRRHRSAPLDRKRQAQKGLPWSIMLGAPRQVTDSRHIEDTQPPAPRHRYDGVALRLVQPRRCRRFTPRVCERDEDKLWLVAGGHARPRHADAVVTTFHHLRTYCARRLTQELRPHDWKQALRRRTGGMRASHNLVQQTLVAAAAAHLVERRYGLTVVLNLERDCCGDDLMRWPEMREARREAERERSARRRRRPGQNTSTRFFQTAQPGDNAREYGRDRVLETTPVARCCNPPESLNGRKPSKSFSPAAQPAVSKAERPVAQAQAPAAAGGQQASASAATARNGDALGRRSQAAAQEVCQLENAPSQKTENGPEAPETAAPEHPSLKRPTHQEGQIGAKKEPIGFLGEQLRRAESKGFARLAPVEETKAKAQPPKDQGPDPYSEEAIQRRLEASRAARAACLQQSEARAAAELLPALPAASTPKPAVEPAAEPAQPEGAPLPPQKLVSSAKALVSATDTCLGALQSAFSNKIHANQLPASMLPQAFGGLPPLASKAAQREPRYNSRFWSLEASERQAMAQALVASWQTSASAPDATELDALRLVFPGLYSAPLAQAMAAHKATMWHLAEALKVVVGQPPGRPHSREALLVGLAQRLAGKTRSSKPR